MKEIQTIDQFEELKESNGSFILLKHSATCPVSHEAFRESETFFSNNPDTSFVFVVVQTSRQLSNAIEEKTGIKHESPQILFFKNGKVSEHASHWNITERYLQNLL